MKPFPPVLREKTRYLSFELVTASNPTKEEAVKALYGAVLDALGKLGAAKAGFSVAKYDEKAKKGILTCNNKEIGYIRAGLALLSRIGDAEAFVRIIRVSGSFKKGGV